VSPLALTLAHAADRVTKCVCDALGRAAQSVGHAAEDTAACGGKGLVIDEEIQERERGVWLGIDVNRDV
jgi:hypothetical protein